MWNQGNGNGQGNGYGQQPQGYYPQQGYGQAQDVYGRLDNSRDVGGARFPYIAAGTHKLVLVTLEEFNGPDNPKARAIFKTLESRTQQPGSFCVKIWGLVKPAKFQNGITEADEFADFCRKLKGAPAGYPISNDIRVLMKERTAEQLARGTVIECTGVAGKQKDPNKEPYVRVYWNTLTQQPQDIAAMRQRIEQEGIPSTGPQQQGGGQFQNAPHPSQMANQYPAQQGMPMQPQQPAPQQGYPAQQPQYAPQPTQGYGQPAPGNAPPQQGGFLPQLPPQGGNGGRGW